MHIKAHFVFDLSFDLSPFALNHYISSGQDPDASDQRQQTAKSSPLIYLTSPPHYNNLSMQNQLRLHFSICFFLLSFFTFLKGLEGK
jgi:hypothetical protein